MAGPLEQKTPLWVVPPGEAHLQYAPSALAYLIQNFEETPEGTLRTIRGPAPYEPNRGQGYPSLGECHGVYHAPLGGGKADMLLVRAGTKLYRHAGWSRSYEQIWPAFGASTPLLNDDTRSYWPDQFCVLNDKIIWCNGVDRPLIVDQHGVASLLGFSMAPSAPTVNGPTQPKESIKNSYFQNAGGYSWPGRIGTAGDFVGDGVTGTLLDGAWYWYIQWEDQYGNLSPLSPASNPFYLASQSAWTSANTINAAGNPPKVEPDDYNTSTIDDLFRQAAVHLSGQGPSNAVATRLYRTPNTKRIGTKPQFLTRFGGVDQSIYPDQASDSELGPVAKQNWPVAPWRVMCTHQNRLVVGNIVGDPGRVRRSEPGFPGTFPEDEWAYPDSGAAEITGLVSHQGRLLAFTDTSAYDLQEFGSPVPLGHGTGCIAPRTIRAMTDGSLIWLGVDGFYIYDGRTLPRRISEGISDVVLYAMNRGRMRMAVSAIHPVSRDYLCAFAPAGKNTNEQILCYNGQTWRQWRTSGLHIADWCVTQDERKYLISCGKDTTISTNMLQVWDREVRSYDPPTRTSIYRSGWLRADKNASQPVHFRTLFLGLVDAYDDTFMVKFFKNGSWDPVLTLTDARAIGMNPVSVAGAVVIGTNKVVKERLFWRQVSAADYMKDCMTWAFEISTNYPKLLHIGAFAFDISPATNGNVRAGRFPNWNDE